MERTILVVVSMPGGGKSEASGYIRSKGISVFKSGDVVRKAVLDSGQPLTIENSENMARKLREEHGNDYPTRVTGEKIKPLKDRVVCVDGPRDIYEIRYLATLGRVIIIWVDAPLELRYERSVSRKGSSLEPKTRDPKDFEEFRWRDRKEGERGEAALKTTKEFEVRVLDNTGTKEELHRKIDEVLKSI